MSMTASLVMLAAVTGIYLVAAAVQRGESWDRRSASLWILPLGAPLLYAKMRIAGDSTAEFVHMLTLAQAGLLAVTLGRPARIVDLSFAGTAEERNDQSRRRQVRLTQYAFVGVGIIAVLIYTIADWSFLG